MGNKYELIFCIVNAGFADTVMFAVPFPSVTVMSQSCDLGVTPVSLR